MVTNIVQSERNFDLCTAVWSEICYCVFALNGVSTYWGQKYEENFQLDFVAILFSL